MALLIVKTALIAPLCRLCGMPLGRQRRNRPVAGTGRRVRLHRHRPCVPVPALSSAEVAARRARSGVADHGHCCRFASPAARLAARLDGRKRRREPSGDVLPPDDHVARVLVVGHGRVGQLVCDLLDNTRSPISPPTTIAVLRRALAQARSADLLRRRQQPAVPASAAASTRQRASSSPSTRRASTSGARRAGPRPDV